MAVGETSTPITAQGAGPLRKHVPNSQDGEAVTFQWRDDCMYVKRATMFCSQNWIGMEFVRIMKFRPPPHF